MEMMTGLHARTPCTHSQWLVRPGRTPQGRAVRRGRVPKPGRPTPRGEAPPPWAPSCRLHNPKSQLARARAVGLVTGPHADTPRTHSQLVAGPGGTPQRWAIGRGRAPNPRRPKTRPEPPPPGALVPRPQNAKPAHKSSHGQGSEPPKARQGGEGTGPPPQELNKQSTRTKQEMRTRTNRLERPYRRPAPEPRVVCAPHRLRGGGRRVRHGSTHTQRTRCADAKDNCTEPAERTARMEWRAGRRREGTTGQDNPQLAPQGTRGGMGAQGEKQEQAAAPMPQNCRERRAHRTRALGPASH